MKSYGVTIQGSPNLSNYPFNFVPIQYQIHTMRSTVDDMGTSDLGVNNDGKGDNMREEALRARGDMEIMSVTSSGYDENESPWELSSSMTTQSPCETAPDLPREVPKENKKEGSPAGIEEDPDGFLSSSENPRDSPCKMPEVTFRESHRETTSDHPNATGNLALDIDEFENENEAVLLDMLAPKMTRAHPKK